MPIFHLMYFDIFLKISMNVIQAVVLSMVVKEHVIILMEVITAVVQADITLHQMEENVQVKKRFFCSIKNDVFRKKSILVRFKITQFYRNLISHVELSHPYAKCLIKNNKILYSI